MTTSTFRYSMQEETALAEPVNINEMICFSARMMAEIVPKTI